MNLYKLAYTAIVSIKSESSHILIIKWLTYYNLPFTRYTIVILWSDEIALFLPPCFSLVWTKACQSIKGLVCWLKTRILVLQLPIWCSSTVWMKSGASIIRSCYLPKSNLYLALPSEILQLTPQPSRATQVKSECQSELLGLCQPRQGWKITTLNLIQEQSKGRSFN